MKKFSLIRILSLSVALVMLLGSATYAAWELGTEARKDPPGPEDWRMPRATTVVGSTLDTTEYSNTDLAAYVTEDDVLLLYSGVNEQRNLRLEATLENITAVSIGGGFSIGSEAEGNLHFPVLALSNDGELFTYNRADGFTILLENVCYAEIVGWSNTFTEVDLTYRALCENGDYYEWTAPHIPTKSTDFVPGTFPAKVREGISYFNSEYFVYQDGKYEYRNNEGVLVTERDSVLQSDGSFSVYVADIDTTFSASNIVGAWEISNTGPGGGYPRIQSYFVLDESGDVYEARYISVYNRDISQPEHTLKHDFIKIRSGIKDFVYGHSTFFFLISENGELISSYYDGNYSDYRDLPAEEINVPIGFGTVLSDVVDYTERSYFYGRMVAKNSGSNLFLINRDEAVPTDHVEILGYGDMHDLDSPILLTKDGDLYSVYQEEVFLNGVFINACTASNAHTSPLGFGILPNDALESITINDHGYAIVPASGAVFAMSDSSVVENLPAHSIVFPQGLMILGVSGTPLAVSAEGIVTVPSSGMVKRADGEVVDFPDGGIVHADGTVSKFGASGSPAAPKNFHIQKDEDGRLWFAWTPPADLTGVTRYGFRIFDSLGKWTRGGSTWDDSGEANGVDIAWLIHGLEESGVYTAKLFALHEERDEGGHWRIVEEVECATTVTLDITIDPVPVAVDRAVVAALPGEGRTLHVDGSFVIDSTSFYHLLLWKEDFPHSTGGSYPDTSTPARLRYRRIEDQTLLSVQRFYDIAIEENTARFAITKKQDPLIPIENTDNPLPTLAITAAAGSGGSISPSGVIEVADGESKTFTIMANSNYRISDVVVDGVSMGAIGSYTFESVTTNHTISVTFEVIADGGTGGMVIPGGGGRASGSAATPAPKPLNVDEILKEIGDVPSGSWFREAVAEVMDYGLMKGTGNGQFSPQATLTRGMFVTILHRLAGEPTAGGIPDFSDVMPGDWYTDAVAWAAENKITLGDGSDRFGTADGIDRQSLIVFLHRYLKGQDKLGDNLTADLTSYSDSGSVADWAAEAVAWAVANGILTGDGTGLNPGGTATRAEAATMLVRVIHFLEGK